jgi:hypothetical protein
MSSKPDDKKAAAADPERMSSQMQAVVRLLAGQEERTIAEKLADSNRPTWEQYKKDNEDKLNLEAVDTKKMDDYRRTLDAERDQLLSRGRNHAKEKKKKKKRRRDDSSDDSSSDSDHHKHKKHKKKRKKKKKYRHRRDDYSSDSSSASSSEERRRRHKRKKKSKKSRKEKDSDGEKSDGSHYRLSKFFDSE